MKTTQVISVKGRGSMHFDGTCELIGSLPSLYDGRRPIVYGGHPERRTLSGTCAAILAAKAYSIAHPRTRVSVHLGGTQGLRRRYIAGMEVTK